MRCFMAYTERTKMLLKEYVAKLHIFLFTIRKKFKIGYNHRKMTIMLSFCVVLILYCPINMSGYAKY